MDATPSIAGVFLQNVRVGGDLTISGVTIQLPRELRRCGRIASTLMALPPILLIRSAPGLSANGSRDERWWGRPWSWAGRR